MRWTIVVGLCFSLRRTFNSPPKRNGVEDVGGVAGIDDVDVVAGVNYVGRVLGGGHGARCRRWSRRFPS